MERWLPVVGFEDRYSVSDQGNVWSNVSGRLLKPFPWGPDYRSARLCKDGVQRRAKIAVLMLEAFVGPRPVGLVARHKDDDRTTDVLSNLSWGTYPQNGRDAVINGRNPHANKTHCDRGHEFTPENTYLRPDGGRNCRACGVENNRRKHGWKKRDRSKCKHGHAMTPENTRINAAGVRRCVICSRRHWRECARRKRHADKDWAADQGR